MSASLKQLERQEWWNWGAGVLITWLLTFAVASLSVPFFAQQVDEWFQFGLAQATRSLIPAVLIFNLYSLYHRVVTLDLRRKLALQVSRTEETEAKARDLYQLAVRDPLTGLYNRRFAEERLVAEVARAQRQRTPLCVLLLDLNGFKGVNDNFGHPAGDSLLCALAANLQATVRAEDVVARIGGDEFLIVLPNCAPESVPAFLARIPRTEILANGGRVKCLYAAGWAALQPRDSAQALIERADVHLYETKAKYHDGVDLRKKRSADFFGRVRRSF